MRDLMPREALYLKIVVRTLNSHRAYRALTVLYKKFKLVVSHHHWVGDCHVNDTQWGVKSHGPCFTRSTFFKRLKGAEFFSCESFSNASYADRPTWFNRQLSRS